MVFDRSNPYPARLLDKRWLTGPESSRPTLHVALSIAGPEGPVFPIEPGDVVAVFAKNDPAEVEAVMRRCGLHGEELRAALTERLSLGTPSLKLLRAAIDRIDDDDEAGALEDLCDDDEAVDAYLEGRDLRDFLDEHPSVRFEAAELQRLLPALQPRTYSVASSQHRHPGEAHLTVGIVRWAREGRTRTGVASAHFERMQPGDTIPLYWTESKHFRMPAPEVPIICVGPGTGIAPYRGFLQERAARGGAPVWLFFGSRTQAHDFYYRDELEALRGGALARLDLAFSRDQPSRTYVQDRMRHAKDELLAWLDRGAHVYLCGDATTMAPAVEATLAELIGPAAFEQLKTTHRYKRDVY